MIYSKTVQIFRDNFLYANCKYESIRNDHYMLIMVRSTIVVFYSINSIIHGKRTFDTRQLAIHLERQLTSVQ